MYPYNFRDPVIVDDVSLEIDELNGFPGPFIKFMIEKMPLSELSRKFNGSMCTFSVACGVYQNSNATCIFEHSIRLKIHHNIFAEGYDFEHILCNHKPFKSLIREDNHPRFACIQDIINSKKFFLN